MAADDQDFVMLDADDIQGFNEEGVLPLPTEKFSEIQKWLAPTDYTAISSEYGKHCASHLAGTGAWILQTDQYQLWHNSDRGALWIKAIAGAGKSVIAASLTSKLATQENVPVLYFFFRHIISANQKPQSLVRDYMSQVLQHSPELQHSLYKLVSDHRSLESVSFDELWKILVAVLARFPRVYCVADALDEMDVSNVFFLHNLVELAQNDPTAIKLLVTSRPVPRVEQVLRHPCVLQITMEPQLVNPDISVYVRHRISEFNISEKVRSQIHERMCARADGHFLYARLMIDDLLEPSKNLISREKELLLALNRLPTSIADMYTQMLLDHSQRSGVPQELQLTLLQWVTGAERPLRVLELSSMIDFKKSVLGVSKEIKSIVREGCGPLLEILEDETVCPIHHSFTEYLFDLDRQCVNSKTATFAVLDYKETQRTIAVTCIRYLASGWHHYLQSAAEHNQSPSDEGNSRALKMKYPFLNYAANNWHRHVLKSGANDASMTSELDSFLLKDHEILPAWLEFITESWYPYKTWQVLHAAAAKGLGFYVEYLIEKGHDIECLDVEQRTPLALAAYNGHDEVVAALLKNGAQSNEADDVGLTPMHHAAMRNHYGVVKLLLESGIDPYTPRTNGQCVKTKEQPVIRFGNARSTVGDTPVECACQNGHVETVKMFIPHLKGEGLHRALCWAIRFRQTMVAMVLLEVPGIDINCVVENQTPLYLAASARDVELMRLLLGMGANAHALSSEYMSDGGIPFGPSWNDPKLSPLHAFAKNGGDNACYTDWDVILMNNGFEMLLDAGLDPNIANPRGLTILHYILGWNNWRLQQETMCGVENTLSLLLDRGLSATLVTPDGSNALHIASGVSATVVDMLTARGVDINQIRKRDGKTPLMAALERRDLVMAQHLLDRGADANLADAEGNSPLHFLAKLPEYQLNLDMIKALIAAGADVNERNKDGNTPMHLTQVNPKLLSTFLEQGFNLEAKNKRGHTLLFHLISQRTGEHHKTLVDAGASPLTRDSQGSTLLHEILGQIQDCGNKTTNLLRYFVQKGVDPLSVDNSGNTLWHVAARLGADCHHQEQLAVMNLLMEYGVPPMARNNAGQTPLHVAFSVSRNYDRYGSIEFLLEHTSADVNEADYDKIRPIHLTSSNDPELTCFLLELGADAAVMTVEGQSPLMVACRTRQCNIVCILLDHYKDHNQLSLINQVDNRGRSALHYACGSGRPETVALLLDAGANVDLKDKEESTPLHVCAEYLDEQISWDRAETFPRSTNAAYVLLTDQSRPKSKDSQRGQDPIRIRETIRLLVANRADTSFLTAKPGYGNRKGNPLSYSIRQGCEAMVSELLIIQDRLLQDRLSLLEQGTAGTEESSNKVTEIDAVKKHWTSALSSYGSRVRFLKMQHMPEIIAENIKPGENNVWLIQQLLKEDDEPSVKEARRLGAHFLELDDRGDNPLHQMASWGFTNLMRRAGQDAARMNTAWVREKAALNINWRRGRLRSILYTALTREIPNLEMVKLLVSEFTLDPNELFSDSSFNPINGSFVHLVACPHHWWQTKALEFLLENGANIEALNSSQETPLITALRVRETYGNIYSRVRARAVEILLLHGANPNAVDENGLTCLNIAARQPNLVKLLLKHGANPSLGLRPFIFDVIVEQDFDTLHIVVESGIDLNVLAQSEPKSEINQTDKQRFIEQHRGKDNLQTWSGISNLDALSKCAYPIHVAASQFFMRTPERIEKAVKIISLLLGAGADPFLFYKDGTSIMHILAEQGGIFEPFFHHPSFDMEFRDHRGRTLLLAACRAKFDRYPSYNPNLLSLLLKRGASLNAVDQDGCNALHYAVSASRFDLIDILLSHGADPLIPDPLDGSTALHHLATGLAEYEDILIHDPIAMLTADDISKLSAEQNLSDDVLCQFLHATSFTPESLARAQLRSPRRHIASLLARGLSIEARDHAGETPLFKLMTATFRGGDIYSDYTDSLFQALKVFEAAGTNFMARNNIGESVLHKLASQVAPRNPRADVHLDEDFQMSFRWLVEKGIDVSWEDEANRTCLDVAAATGAQWVLDMYKRK